MGKVRVANLLIIDTDILIDVARGDSQAISNLKGHQQTFALAISAVTQMELIVGCRNKIELKELEQLLLLFQILKLTIQISDTAVGLLYEYRLSHGLVIADALIAATTLVQDVPFVTKNQRDYRFIAGLNLLPYP